MPLPAATEEVYTMRLADLDADGKPELVFSGGDSSGSGPTNYYVFHNVSQ